MSRVVLCALAVLLCVFNVRAQFDVEPKGPFTRFTAAAGIPFKVRLTDPNVSIDYYRWNLFVNDKHAIKLNETKFILSSCYRACFNH